MDLTLVVPDGKGETSAALPAGISCERKSRLREALGEHVLVVDPGHPVDPGLLERLWAKREEAEIVMASRYLRGGGSEAPALASLATRLSNRLLRRTLRLPCHDLASGVRLYRRSALEELGPETLDRATPLELLVRLHNRGFKLREVAYHEPGGRGTGPVLAELASGLRELPRLAKLRRSGEPADLDDVAFDAFPPWRRRRLEERKKTIVSFLEVDGPLLDVGCGSSRLIQSLSRGTGLDPDFRKLRYLRGRAKALVRGALPRLPFRDGSFPQVVCAGVAGSKPWPAAYLAELRRVLASRGTLVLAMGGTESDLKEGLKSSGFAVDEVRRIRGRELVVRAVRREGEIPGPSVT